MPPKTLTALTYAELAAPPARHFKRISHEWSSLAAPNRNPTLQLSHEAMIPLFSFAFSTFWHSTFVFWHQDPLFSFSFIYWVIIIIFATRYHDYIFWKRTGKIIDNGDWVICMRSYCGIYKAWPSLDNLMMHCEELWRGAVAFISCKTQGTKSIIHSEFLGD